MFGCTCSAPGITTYLHNRQYCKTKIAKIRNCKRNFLLVAQNQLILNMLVMIFGH